MKERQLVFESSIEPEEFPDTIDLMALAEALEARGGKRKLAAALRSAWVAQSCLADLNQAQGVCEALAQLPKIARILPLATLTHIQGALLTSAILLYVRATHTSGPKNERGSTQLESGKLTPQQRDDHRTLIRIRNGALGHVESRAPIEGDLWHVDYLFAKRVGPGTWGIASASTAIAFNRDTLEVLVRQLPIATHLVLERARRRFDIATDALAEVNPSSAVMLRHRVDPAEWFGSAQSARLMLSGKPGEVSSAWIPLL